MTTVGHFTFILIAGSGCLRKLLLLELRHSLIGTWMESLMLQAWQSSSNRVSHDRQNPPPASTFTGSRLTEDLLSYKRRPMGNQKAGQKEDIFPD